MAPISSTGGAMFGVGFISHATVLLPVWVDHILGVPDDSKRYLAPDFAKKGYRKATVALKMAKNGYLGGTIILSITSWAESVSSEMEGIYSSRVPVLIWILVQQ